MEQIYTEITTQTSRSLWNYYRDEIHNTNNNSSHGKSFKHRKVVEKKKQRSLRMKKLQIDQQYQL